MNSEDLQVLGSLKNAMESKQVAISVQSNAISNPAKEVEGSLVSFLKHRLNNLQEAAEYETTVKETLMARITEATFPQLMGLLDILQKNNNTATEKVLAPFIAQNGNRSVTETLKEDQRLSATTEAVLYGETDDKKILQSLSALSQFLEMTKGTSPSNSCDSTESSGA